MWLWLSLCFASTVLAQNDILASGTTKTSNKPERANEEVLLKIWTIFADLLDVDGKTVKVPSRDKIQFALTLIKKTMLEKKDRTDVDLKEKLFLLESELAKSKGVYLHDSRPLHTLLDLELVPNRKSNVIFKYELRANDKPKCKQAFEELIQRVHQNYDNLAKSPICSEGPINPQSPLYSIHIPGSANQDQLSNAIIKQSGNTVEKLAATWKWNGNNNAEGLIKNPNYLESAQTPVLKTNEQNNLYHAVKLSNETHHLIGNDYTADLEHANNVADRINALYQASNTLTPPVDPVLYPKQSLRELNTNYGAFSMDLQNNHLGSSPYSRPVIQSGYVTQSQINPLNNGWNQSYIITANTMETQPPVKNIIINHEYTNPLNTFVNSKYHPNHDHDSEATPAEVPINAENIPKIDPPYKKLPFYFQTALNQGKEKVTEIRQPETFSQFPYQTPIRTNGQSEIRNLLNYNVYTYPNSNNQNFLQNSHAFKSSYNPYGFKFNSYNNSYQRFTQPSELRPGYTSGYNNYMFQQSVVNPQGKLFTTKYLTQNPNTVFSQKVIQSIPPTYKLNVQPKPIYNYAYGVTHNIETNVPQFTHTSNYYNHQPVIDKLAGWVTGTNSVKLNADNDEAEVELTYLVKKPPLLYRPTMFYIKFRVPYKSLAKHIDDIMKMQNLRTDSSDTDLYTNLASQYNATVIPSDMSAIPEDLKSTYDKLLVKARYIEPGKNDPTSVDIINLVDEPELKNGNLEEPVNTVADNV